MPRLTPALVASALLHLGLLALAFVAWPREEVEIQLGAVPVTIVSDIVQAAAPAPETAPDTPLEEVTPEPPSSEPETPEAAAPTPRPTPAPPQPTPPVKRPEPPRPTPTPTPSRPTPDRPTQPRPPTTPPREETPTLDLGAIAGSGPSRPPTRPATESGSGTAPVATGPQVAFLGSQVEPHWNLTFCDLAGGDELTIRMRLTISAGGRITEGPVLVQPQAGSVYRAASESAMRAAQRAQPYDVPDGFRTSQMVFVFPTSRACQNR